MHDLKRHIPPASMDYSLYEVRSLEYSYPDGTQALQGVDLNIAPGERVALVGHNGSGKTTLVKQLCGLLAPGSGSLCYRGEEMDGSSPGGSGLEIGLLFQDPDDQLFGNHLVEDVAFGPRNQGLAFEPARDKALKALEQVGLGHLAYKAPHNLSYGQKKRAALAGLLAMEPKVLILDEPTANLDPQQEEVFLDLLKGFDGTLICISHDLIFLYELCQRAVVLDGGKIHHDYSMKDLVSQREALREHGLDFSFRFSSEQTFSSAAEPLPPAEISPLSSDGALSPLVEFGDYSFSYPDGTNALKGMSLNLGEAERIALVGENGAGKTTFLSCLMGLKQGVGTYRFAEAEVTRKSRKKLWQKVGMVFQDCSDQLFCPSVAEEVAFGLQQMGLGREEIERRVEAALERVRLTGFEERVPLHLSGGERKRLALACVLAMEPRVLILDEPTAGLDPMGEELLLEILRGLESTLILVSHDMFFVGALTERTVVMHRGEVIHDMATEEFLRDDRLAALNGLNYSYRRRGSEEIRRLQHAHEHSHLHRHYHDHPHSHGDLVHSHPHEHEHDHSHEYFHVHHEGEQDHGHLPAEGELHSHEHEGHEEQAHDHEH